MDFLFPEDDEKDIVENNNNKWNILIVDDEPEVHAVTKLALNDFVFDNKCLNFISAYSGKEAKEKLNEYNNISVVFLDIVMETDDAGIDVVKYIRNTIKNKKSRIILRTGQPGTYPERDIVENYDINDYKNKTELSAQKLRTSISSSLRSYKDIVNLSKYQNIIKNTVANFGFLLKIDDHERFNSMSLKRTIRLINELYENQVLDYFTIDKTNNKNYKIENQTEYYKNINWTNFDEYNCKDLQSKILESIDIQNHIIYNNYIIIYYGGRPNDIDFYNRVIVIETEELINNEVADCISLLSITLNNLFQNMILKKEIRDSQTEIINLLGEAIETRSKESGNHVKRVAKVSKVIALGMGFSEQEATLIETASPLHDLGKIGISDVILNKKGKLTENEINKMRTHVDIGYDILKTSKHKAFKYAAIIAKEHHEKWDGTGYPDKLKGDSINILGRITALSDVFDALMSHRCYKKSWSFEDAIELIKNEKGKHFDPDIVDVFLQNIDEIMLVRESLPY
jgi:response regulator RpfG family c-di-GMP phosphodiesterase